MARTTDWMDKIEVIDRPKPKEPSVKVKLTEMFEAAARDNQVIRIPKKLLPHFFSCYGFAKAAGKRMVCQKNGKHALLWWE